MDDKIAQVPTKDGKVPFKISSLAEPSLTYYKIVGDLSCGRTPVIVLHGGPSAGHGYVYPFAALWLTHGLPVVFYDQIGCGLSSHLPETYGDHSLWHESTYVAELENLIDHLQLRKGFHVLGHSWGGLVAAAFAANRPRGLRRLVLGSPSSSAENYLRGNEMNRKELPLECQKAISQAIATRDFNSQDYLDAFGVFVQKFLCHIDPMPKIMQAGVANMESDKTASESLGGYSPFVNGGSMAHYTLIPRLPRISAPTLVWNCEWDIMHDITVDPFFELIPRVRRVKWAGSGHIVHLEGNGVGDKVVKLAGDFLAGGSSEHEL